MAFVKSLSGGRVAAKYFNMRLAPPEVSGGGEGEVGVRFAGCKGVAPISLPADRHPCKVWCVAAVGQCVSVWDEARGLVAVVS